MNLVRIGQMVLNFDLVARIDDLSSPGATSPGPYLIDFCGKHPVYVIKDAPALQAWLAANQTIPTASNPVPSS